MPLMPKRTKYRKQMKGRLRGKAMRGNTVTYGHYGMQATEAGFITSNQIEAARVAMTRYMKRSGKVWIKIFPDKPLTAKPLETRMGKGKGAVECYVAKVKPGRVMFEIAGVPIETAKVAFERAGHKLPVKYKFVERKLSKKELKELQAEVLAAEAAAEVQEELEEAQAEAAENTEANTHEKEGAENENK